MTRDEGPPVEVEIGFPGSWGPADLPIASVGGTPLTVVAKITLRAAQLAGAPVVLECRGERITDRLPSRPGATMLLRLDTPSLYYGQRSRLRVHVSVGRPPVHRESASFEVEGVR